MLGAAGDALPGIGVTTETSPPVGFMVVTAKPFKLTAAPLTEVRP